MHRSLFLAGPVAAGMILLSAQGATAQYFGPAPNTGSEIREVETDRLATLEHIQTEIMQAMSPDPPMSVLTTETLLPLLEGPLTESQARKILVDASIPEDSIGDTNPIFVLGLYVSDDLAALSRLKLPSDSEVVGAVRLNLADFRERQTTRRVWYPIAEGRRGIVRFYSDSSAAAGIRAIGRFAANIRNDQIFVTTDIIDGAIGPVPFGIASAAVVTQSDSVGGQEIEGLTSDLTRLVYNGGTLALRLTLPFVLATWTDVGALASLGLQAGLLGDLSEPDALAASFTSSLDANLRFRVLSLVDDSPVGSILVPLRVGWAYSENDFGPDPFEFNNFGFLQVGFGLADPSGKFKLTALFTHPFRGEVQEALPRFVLSLGAIR